MIAIARLLLFALLAGIGMAWLMFGTDAHAEPPPQPMPWVQVQELWLTPSPARIYSDNVVYTQFQTGQPCTGWCYPGQWQAVSTLQWGVPADAKFAFLSGMLIITHGTTVETADIHVVFRRPGDTTVTCQKYLGQTVEAQVGGGQRSMLATWVPMSNGVFEWCFTTSTTGDWPVHSAYAVNMSLQGWAR